MQSVRCLDMALGLSVSPRCYSSPAKFRNAFTP
jgi:hypothetical protein